MTAGQPYYSPQMSHVLPPVAEEVIQVDIQNNWDALAEIAVASYPEPNLQSDHLALLLESHGIIVHRVSAPRPPSYSCGPSVNRSSFLADLYATPTRLNGAAHGTAREKNSAHTRPHALFPQSAALVYGNRVIEVPPALPRISSDDASLSSTCQSDQGPPEHTNALFSLLENAGVEVVRWPITSPSAKSQLSEGTLVENEEMTISADTEDEGPRFSPSDILVLSPTLLITRLSSCTNDKGLEYLWSVLSRPTKSVDLGRRQVKQREYQMPPSAQPAKPPRATTTLLVRITEPDTSTNTSAAPSSMSYSPRASINSINQLIQRQAPSSYTPLCRALVPIDGHIMLYDPALMADGEARRLKSVLDRVQEGSRERSRSSGEMSELLARSTKRDSTISYGTFGSAERDQEEGWQFIRVEGLHLTSILLVSPSLALLSPAPSNSATSPTSTTSNHDAVLKVSQILGSLGVRTVSLPFSELNEKGGGVHDAVMVLRRESYADVSDDGYAERGQENVWNQSTPDEEPTEGCLDTITASISSFFCGLFSGFISSTSDSDTDVESR